MENKAIVSGTVYHRRNHLSAAFARLAVSCKEHVASAFSSHSLRFFGAPFYKITHKPTPYKHRFTSFIAQKNSALQSRRNHIGSCLCGSYIFIFEASPEKSTSPYHSGSCMSCSPSINDSAKRTISAASLAPLRKSSCIVPYSSLLNSE